MAHQRVSEGDEAGKNQGTEKTKGQVHKTNYAMRKFKGQVENPPDVPFGYEDPLVLPHHDVGSTALEKEKNKGQVNSRWSITVASEDWTHTEHGS